MDPLTVSIVLIVLGLILIVAESMMPGGYLVIPGIDLLVIGVYGLAFPGMLFTWVTVAVAIVLTIPVVVGTLWAYRHLGGPEPPSTTVTGSLVGRTGTVTVETEPGTLKGKVRIGSDIWSADSDEVIPVDAEVTVVSSEGVHVFVKKV